MDFRLAQVSPCISCCTGSPIKIGVDVAHASRPSSDNAIRQADLQITLARDVRNSVFHVGRMRVLVALRAKGLPDATTMQLLCDVARLLLRGCCCSCCRRHCSREQPPRCKQCLAISATSPCAGWLTKDEL